MTEHQSRRSVNTCNGDFFDHCFICDAFMISYGVTSPVCRGTYGKH